MVLHDGSIAETKIDDGKSLVSTLSAYLNVLTNYNNLDIKKSWLEDMFCSVLLLYLKHKTEICMEIITMR